MSRSIKKIHVFNHHCFMGLVPSTKFFSRNGMKYVDIHRVTPSIWVGLEGQAPDFFL